MKETCPVDYPTNLGTVNGNGLCCSNGDIGSFNTAALQACPSPEPTPSPTTTDQAAAAAYKKQLCAPVDNAISKGVGCLSVRDDDESTCNSCGCKYVPEAQMCVEDTDNENVEREFATE